MSSFFMNLLRPEDCLNVQFEFVNLALDATNSGRLRLKRASPGPAFIVVRLPCQHIAEQAVGGDASPRLPYVAFVSCPSRISFRLPEAITEIPFTIDALLRLITELEPLTSDPPPDGGPATVIEFPDRLLLIPEPGTRLFHRDAPKRSAATQRTEIWETRISAGSPNQTGRFRAVFNPVDVEGSDRPLVGSLTREHREGIVKRSQRDPSKPHVIAYSTFTVNALGASARLKSDWLPDDFVSLQAWDHNAEGGRDLYVSTVEKGFLFPFGHKATLIKITQRQFSSHFPVNVAELVQKPILLVHEEERNYENIAGAYTSKGREMPFKRVRIAPSPRFLDNDRDPIRFAATVIDTGGNLIDCHLVMTFVRGDEARRQDHDFRQRHAQDQAVALERDDLGLNRGRIPDRVEI